MAARLYRFQQLQRAVQKSHVTVGGDDIGAIFLYRHAILGFKDLHARKALNNFTEYAFMIRRQVLHQNKRHIGIDIGRHAGKKGFKSCQPARRSAYADNGKNIGDVILKHCLRSDWRDAGVGPVFLFYLFIDHTCSNSSEKRFENGIAAI